MESSPLGPCSATVVMYASELGAVTQRSDTTLMADRPSWTPHPDELGEGNDARRRRRTVTVGELLCDESRDDLRSATRSRTKKRRRYAPHTLGSRQSWGLRQVREIIARHQKHARLLEVPPSPPVARVKRVRLERGGSPGGGGFVFFWAFLCVTGS